MPQLETEKVHCNELADLRRAEQGKVHYFRVRV